MQKYYLDIGNDSLQLIKGSFRVFYNEKKKNSVCFRNHLNDYIRTYQNASSRGQQPQIGTNRAGSSSLGLKVCLVGGMGVDSDCQL